MAKALALGLAGALALSALAMAGSKPEIDATVKITNPATGTYQGKVKPEKRKRCQKRNVTVYHDENENGADDSDYVIGSTKSDRKGKWTVHGNQAPAGDTVVAVAEEKETSRQICTEAEGETIATG